MTEYVKMWLDDVRPAPDNWVWCKTADEARALLAQGDVYVCSLDHDLGPPSEGTGYDVLTWVERCMAEGVWYGPLPVIHIHSANPVGRMRMDKARQSINKLYDEWQSSLIGQEITLSQQ